MGGPAYWKKHIPDLLYLIDAPHLKDIANNIRTAERVNPQQPGGQQFYAPTTKDEAIDTILAILKSPDVLFQDGWITNDVLIEYLGVRGTKQTLKAECYSRWSMP